MGWTFLTNYGHALIVLARNPQARVREVALAVGISDRAAQTILNELVDAGYVTRERRGRRNRYILNTERPLRHPLEQQHAIGDLLRALGGFPAGGSSADPAPRPDSSS